MPEKESSFNIHSEIRKISQQLENLNINPQTEVCCGANFVHFHFKMGDNTVDVSYIPNLNISRPQDARIEIVSCIPYFSTTIKINETRGGLKKLVEVLSENYKAKMIDNYGH